MNFLFTIWFILEQVCEIGFTRPIYWEVRLREVRRLVQNHTAGKKLNLDLNSDFLTPETRLFVGRGKNSVNKGTNCQLAPKSWPLKGTSLNLLPSRPLPPFSLSFPPQSLQPCPSVPDGRPRISHPDSHHPGSHPAGTFGADGEKGHSDLPNPACGGR